MMVEFGWIKMYFLLIPVLQITAAVTGQHLLSFIVRVGDKVTLPCENLLKRHKCHSTTWLFSGSGSSSTVELITLGQIGKNTKSKSHRLSVTANCSLVIKKVTVEDVGRYSCRQFISDKQQGEDSQVHLSVINMTEHKDTDTVTLTCSVSTYEKCRHTVKWLFEGKDVDKDNKDIKTSKSRCSANVTFPRTSHYIYTSKDSKKWKCNVKDGYTEKVQKFIFSLQSSGKETGATTKSAMIKTMEESTTLGTNKTKSANNDKAKKAQDWWWYILVAVGLAALLIIVVVVARWMRAKANKTRMDDKIELTSNPAVTPEISQDTADPEDGVSYASISYTKTSDSKGRVWAKSDDDEDEAVTYSTVKVSSSSAGTSADPSDHYATIDKPNK